MMAGKVIQVREEMESRNEMVRMEMEEKVKKLENENAQLRVEIGKKDAATKEKVETLEIYIRKVEQNNTDMKNEITEIMKEFRLQSAALTTQMKDVGQKSLNRVFQMV